jgi:hypothetical protein
MLSAMDISLYILCWVFHCVCLKSEHQCSFGRMVKTPGTNSSVVASTQNNNTQNDQCGELQVQSFTQNQASINYSR